MFLFHTTKLALFLVQSVIFNLDPTKSSSWFLLFSFNSWYCSREERYQSKHNDVKGEIEEEYIETESKSRDEYDDSQYDDDESIERLVLYQ